MAAVLFIRGQKKFETQIDLNKITDGIRWVNADLSFRFGLEKRLG